MISLKGPADQAVKTTGVRGPVPGSDIDMSTPTTVYHPGKIVPVSGIYRCDDGEDGHVYESTDVKGHRFPPMPRGCQGHGWVLERAAGRR